MTSDRNPRNRKRASGPSSAPSSQSKIVKLDRRRSSKAALLAVLLGAMLLEISRSGGVLGQSGKKSILTPNRPSSGLAREPLPNNKPNSQEIESLGGAPFYSIKDGKASARPIQQDGQARKQESQFTSDNLLPEERAANGELAGGFQPDGRKSPRASAETRDSAMSSLERQQMGSLKQLVGALDELFTGSPQDATTNPAVLAQETTERPEQRSAAREPASADGGGTSTGRGQFASALGVQVSTPSSISMSLDGMVLKSRPRASAASGATKRKSARQGGSQRTGELGSGTMQPKASRRVPFSGAPFSSPAAKGQRVRPTPPRAPADQEQSERRPSGEVASGGVFSQPQEQQGFEEEWRQRAGPRDSLNRPSEARAGVELMKSLLAGGGPERLEQAEEQPPATNGEDMVVSVMSSPDGKERRLVMIARNTLDALQRFAAAQNQQRQVASNLDSLSAGLEQKDPADRKSEQADSSARFQQEAQAMLTTTTQAPTSLSPYQSQPTTTTTQQPSSPLEDLSKPGQGQEVMSEMPFLFAGGNSTMETPSGIQQTSTASSQGTFREVAVEPNSIENQQVWSGTQTRPQGELLRQIPPRAPAAKTALGKQSGGGSKKSARPTVSSNASARKKVINSIGSGKENNASGKQPNSSTKTSAKGKSSKTTTKTSANKSVNGGSGLSAASNSSGQQQKHKTLLAELPGETSSQSAGASSLRTPFEQATKSEESPSTVTPTGSPNSSAGRSSQEQSSTLPSGPVGSPPAAQQATPDEANSSSRQLEPAERQRADDSGEEAQRPPAGGGSGQRAAGSGELANLRNAIPGEPLQDYPIYGSPPKTSFSCKSQSCPAGYYADQETQCQVFHICQNDGKFDTFLCPNGTIFSQQHFVCVWWWQVDCQQSAALYKLNDGIYCNSVFPGSGPSSENLAGRAGRPSAATSPSSQENSTLAMPSSSLDSSSPASPENNKAAGSEPAEEGTTKPTFASSTSSSLMRPLQSAEDGEAEDQAGSQQQLDVPSSRRRAA